MAKVEPKTVRDNLWIGAGTLGTSALAILGYGFAVHFLGESSAGIVGVMLAVLSTSAALGGLGMNLALVREASKTSLANTTLKSEIGVATTVAIGVGVLCLGAMVFAGPMLLALVKFQGDRADALRYCALAGSAAVLIQVTGVCRALNQSQSEFRATSIMDIGASFLQSAGTILALSIFRNLTTIGIVTLLVSSAQLAGYYHSLYRRWGIMPWPSWSQPAFSRLWHFGRWPHLGSIFVIIGDSFDRILLGTLFGSASVPAYAMAKSFYTQSHALLASQAYYLFPRVAASGRAMGIETETRLIGMVSLFSGWIYLTVFLTGPLLAALSADDIFAEKVSSSLLVFCLMGWANSLCLIVYFSKMAEGYSKLALIMNVISGPGTLVAMWLLGWGGGLRWAIAGQSVMLGGVFWLLSLNEANRPDLAYFKVRLLAALPTGIFAVGCATGAVLLRGHSAHIGVRAIFAIVFVLVLYLPVAARLAQRLPGGPSLSASLSSIIAALPIPGRIAGLMANLLAVRT